MKNNFKKLLLISSAVIFLSAGLFFAQSALAAPLDLGLQPLNATGLGHADIRIIIGNIIRVALGLLGILAVGLMLYAGFEWMTSGGNEEQIGTAKKILINATIGLAIILSSYSIVAFVMTKLVEATGFNGGVDPACKAQVDKGGASCDNACPPCGGDGDLGVSFHITQKPAGGNVCVANYYPIFVFNKDVDVDTLNHTGNDGHPDNLKVINNLTGGVLDGTWHHQNGNLRQVYFTSPTQCAGNANYYCFESNTAYKVVVANSGNIKTKSGTQSLTCSGLYNCDEVSFTSGSAIDTLPPQITVTYPQDGDNFNQTSTVAISVHYVDDIGLQTLNLNVDNKFISSVKPVNNCQASGTLNINWDASKNSLGAHNLGLTGIDWANNQTLASLSVSLKPGHCYNNAVDDTLGEKFTFAPPAGDCGGECGACAGDVCQTNSDCSSGWCEKAGGAATGVCVNRVRVDSFSLDNGAVGDYVSVLGRYFGTTTGHVYFSTGTNWIEAMPVNCGAGFNYWTQNQIIVSVPTGTAPIGPLKVVTAVAGTNGTDTTGDSWGAQSNFTITNVSHPGICSISPVTGYPGQSFSVSGKGFGALANFNATTDGLFFQGEKSKINSWADNLIGSAAPVGLGNGDFTVQAKKNGLFSNGIRFSISGFNPNGPTITDLSATSTAHGDYLVIYGKNFGSQTGSVIFNKDGNTSNANITGGTDFPTECAGASTWSDGQVVVKVPSSTDLNSDFSVRVKLADNITVSPVDSNFFIHTIPGDAKPGICLVDPSSGPVPFAGPNFVNIYGDNLDNINAVYFWKIGASSTVLSSLVSAGVVLDTVHHIKTQPSAVVNSGPVFVTTLGSKRSNALQFSVFDCTKNNNTCSDAANFQCCAVGQQNGMCIPAGQTCIGAKRSAGYVWLFSTGGISPVPQVVERCNADTEAGNLMPTPAPSTLWNVNGQVDASNVCQTAVVTVEFSAKLDQASVNSSTIKLFKCDSINGDTCVNQNQISASNIDPSSYTLLTSNNVPGGVPHDYLNISLKDNTRWTSSTWYQVQISSSTKSITSTNKYNQTIQFGLAHTRPCGGDTAYCFAFRTGEGDCKLRQVVVTPSQFWTNVLEEPIRYHSLGGIDFDITYAGNGLSNQRCIMMNVNGFDWTWSPTSTDYVKRLSTFGPSNRFAQFGAEANTVGIGLPNNSVNINATAATTTSGVLTSKTGTSTLTIDLSNPQVVDFEPKCLEACTDALVSATFNVSMSDKNKASAVKLYKCADNDENCLAPILVDTTVPSIESHSNGDRRWLKIFNNIGGQSLLPNTMYKVVLSASSSPDFTSNLQLWSLGKANDLASYSKPFNKEFSWRFRTKKEACTIDRIEVTPKIFNAQKLNDRAVFTAQPYSAPDACSASGQKLNPYKSNWNWASSDLQVATITTSTVKGRNLSCTGSCLLTGSNIPSGSAATSYPVCGNATLEAGEDCLTPSTTANCNLNCLNIVKTKKGSQMKTESTDVNASICGNGLLGVDEDCDLGITASSTATTSAMNCSASCLHAGTPLSAAWCKNHATDKGGFTPDQFNQACVNAYSRCGDGVQDYNEDPGCDTGNGGHDISCNNSCLKLYRCNAGDEGCSANAQKQGSSLIYSTPSVCGDGITGIGEDSQCENVANFSTTTLNNLISPWVLAIGQGGGKPAGEPPVQFSNINATTNSKTGTGKYQVQCGWKNDSECAGKYSDPNRGVADDSCCYLRPQLTKVYPGATSTVVTNICINTYIEADFDSVINVNTLPGNLLLAKYNASSNVCATGTEMVSTSLIAELQSTQNLAWYQKAWHKVVVFVQNIFGNKFAQASVWCAGSDLAMPTVVPNSAGGSKIILQLNQALSPTTTYAIVLKPGIKDTKGVSIRTGAGGKPLGWKFTTGDNICEVSSVKVDPPNYVFSTAASTTALTALAQSQNNQLIVPVPGYSWQYSWGPKVNDFVTVSNTTSSINNIVSQNRNGELDVYVNAKIIENKFTKQAGLVGTGRSHIIVFLCEHPWPPLRQMVGATGPFTIFPYEDKTGNNDNFNIASNTFDNTAIPPSQVVNAGYFNFSSYYCADSGASGNLTDDLPYLKPAVQVASTTLGNGTFATSTYVVTSTVVTTSTLVTTSTVPATSTCANNPAQACVADTDCGTAKIVKNNASVTFAASSTKSGVCYFTYAGGGGIEYYPLQGGSKLSTGQDFSCSNTADCFAIVSPAVNPNVIPYLQTLPNYNGNSSLNCKPLLSLTSTTISTCDPHTKIVTSTQEISTSNIVSSNAINSIAKPFNALKRFFFTNANNNDAIGVQILSNPKHLTARQWFELDQKFKSQNLQDISVDGYDAVSDGSNIYVNALNFSSAAANSGNLYTNTYLFSINSNATDETKKVFEQFVKNIKFNLNLTNDKRCIVPGNGPDADAKACETDFDCVSTSTPAEVCSAQKSKLQRDFSRLQDMGKIFDALDSYSKQHNGTYPDLKSGTYLTGQTVSTWSSWSLLSGAVNTPATPFPAGDPINKLGIAGTCGFSTSSVGTFCTSDAGCASQISATDKKCVLHSPDSGWSTENQRYSFACAPDSLAYRYIATSTSSTVPGADNYTIKMNWEIIGPGQGLNILNKDNLFNDFVPSAAASKFNSTNGICNQSNEIASLVVGTCGDGKVGKNEQCDPPGSINWNLTECDGATAATTLHGNICAPVTCQWQINATSTTCGAKLAKCKNGIIEVGEACDEGVLNGQYGHCNPTCTGFTSTCGDGTVSSTFEVCDTKSDGYLGWCVGGTADLNNIFSLNNSCSTDSDCNNYPIDAPTITFTTGKCATLSLNNSKYSLTKTNSCASDCQKYGPYCGDGIVQSQFGEDCEGGQTCSLSVGGTTSAGQRKCDSYCHWQQSASSSLALYFNFDNIWVSNGYSHASNLASGQTLLLGNCSGNQCPATSTSANLGKKQAMNFDGNSDYFKVASSSDFNLNELTFATWINVDPSAPNDFIPLLTKNAHFEDDGRNSSHNRDYNFYIKKTASGMIDTIHMYSSYYPDPGHLTKVNSSGQTVASDTVMLGVTGVNPNIAVNEWHFIAVTVNAARQTRYYLDGNLIGGPFLSGSTTLKADHAYPIWIGRGDDGYFKGKMDDVQLYKRALSDSEISDLYTHSGNFCELNSAPVSVAEVSSNCGDGKIDNGQNGTQDKGEVCDKGSQNGVACTSSYNKSCTYCAADCKNVVTVNAAGYCGDGIINGTEKCEVDSIGSLVSFATSSGTGDDYDLSRGLGTFNEIYPNHGGYKVLQCYDEFNTTLNASSTYWYNQFLAGVSGAGDNLVGKIGEKSCATNCGINSKNPVISSCVACGLSDKGVVVSGAVLNVLDPAGSNPLIAESAAVIPTNGHLGYIDLLYSQKNSAATGNIGAYKVAFDQYGFGSNVSSYKLHPQSGVTSDDALIEPNPICYDNSQSRYYRLALNADWSKEHMIDFPVFSSAQPESYNLFLSPVIARDAVVSTVNTVARPNDYRFVVSWVGKDMTQFSAGFFHPGLNTPYMPSVANATGLDYFTQASASGVWFHGFGPNNNNTYNANVEAFTINTSTMSTSSYAFFVKVNADTAKMAQAGKDAELKVEIYAPEVQHSQEDNDVYRHFARPVKVFYFSQAQASNNPDAQYWHVFNFVKNTNAAAEFVDNHVYVGTQYNSIRTDIKLVY